jgi:prefoldin subunit 5
MDVGLAVKAAEDIDKAVGIVAKLVAKLKAQPDLAAEKLGQALGEVAKTLQVVDNATSQYLRLVSMRARSRRTPSCSCI